MKKIWLTRDLVKQMFSTPELLVSIFHNLIELNQSNLDDNLAGFFSQHECIYMKGAQPIKKYRLDHSNRILIVTGAAIQESDNIEKDDIILLSWASHDKQGYTAKRIDLSSI